MRLIEIMVTLAIVSAIGLLSISGYQSWRADKELQYSAKQFISALELGKRMSILKNTKIYLCASTNLQTCNEAWQGRLVLFAGDPAHIENTLAEFTALPAMLTLSFSGLQQYPFLYFMNDGEVANNGSLLFRLNHKTLRYTVSKTGIVRETK